MFFVGYEYMNCLGVFICPYYSQMLIGYGLVTSSFYL